VVRPVMTDLMDDLAYQIHEYLLEESVSFEGSHLVLIPITDLVKKFQKNHRTINRRLTALKEEGLLVPLIKKTYGTLYDIRDPDEDTDG
jgi:DNA-binding transcriptional ArsR family regulator